MKISELISKAQQILVEAGDIDVAVLDAAGQDSLDIEFISESDDGNDRVTRVVLCDPATAEELTNIEDMIDDLDDDKIIN